MAFLLPKNGYIVKDGVAFNCQTQSEVELDREFEKIVCHENAPGGSLALGEITATMSITGIMGDSDTNGFFEAATDLIDGTEVVALFRSGLSGQKGIQFNAYITNAKATSDQTGKTLGYTVTLTNSGDPSVVTL
jgi:hypothetical protein